MNAFGPAAARPLTPTAPILSPPLAIALNTQPANGLQGAGFVSSPHAAAAGAAFGALPLAGEIASPNTAAAAAQGVPVAWIQDGVMNVQFVVPTDQEALPTCAFHNSFLSYLAVLNFAHVALEYPSIGVPTETPAATEGAGLLFEEMICIENYLNVVRREDESRYICFPL